MKPLFCISSGQQVLKKGNTRVNRRNRYLNYGLLGLATVLRQAGWSPLVLHGHFENPASTVERCLKLGLIDPYLPVLLSLPSFYALSWARLFLTHLKLRVPGIRVIVGGRWVVGDDPALLKVQLPAADVIVQGLSESKIIGLVRSFSQHDPPHTTVSRPETQGQVSLDYSLLVDRALYQPSIEVSRGCGMGCHFCQEKALKLQSLKSPDRLLDEVEATLLHDQLRPMTSYLEASMFVPNRAWSTHLLAEEERRGVHFSWRAEGRVDALKPEHLEQLAHAGLKILDLGLESASHQQLFRMGKTRSPEKYLRKASLLLKEAHRQGIQVKINVLLYAGETLATLAETACWLDEHRAYVRGVSVGPVIAFGAPAAVGPYLEELRAHGSSVSHSPAFGVTHLHLSREVDFPASLELSRQLSRRFMSSSDYFFLKSFSYFPRDYSYADFLLECELDRQERDHEACLPKVTPPMAAT